MSAPVLVWVEEEGGELTKPSREALSCAQSLGSDVRAFKANDACVDCVCALVEKEKPSCLIAPSTPRGRDVLAHAASLARFNISPACARPNASSRSTPIQKPQYFPRPTTASLGICLR